MPKAMAKKIISLQSRFFWGSNSNHGSMLTIKWSQIQLPKNLGGLSVGDIQMKNAAMLFK